MPNFQPQLSLRKTRQGVLAALESDAQQRKALAILAGQINAQGAVLRRGFFGRLRWLLFGANP